MSLLKNFLDKKNPYISSFLSLIKYTVLVITTFGAVLKFTYFDAKMEKKQAEIEAQKATIEMFSKKVDFLESDNESLFKQNEKYSKWLIQEHNTIPFYEKKIQELETSLETLNEQYDKVSKDSIRTPKLYSFTKSIRKSGSFDDPVSHLIFSVIDIDSNDNATVRVDLPESTEVVDIHKITVGYNGEYKYGGKTYKFHVASIDWITNTCSLEINEIANNSFDK